MWVKYSTVIFRHKCTIKRCFALKRSYLFCSLPLRSVQNQLSSQVMQAHHPFKEPKHFHQDETHTC